MDMALFLLRIADKTNILFYFARLEVEFLNSVTLNRLIISSLFEPDQNFLVCATNECEYK